MDRTNTEFSLGDLEELSENDESFNKTGQSMHVFTTGYAAAQQDKANSDARVITKLRVDLDQANTKIASLEAALKKAKRNDTVNRSVAGKDGMTCDVSKICIASVKPDQMLDPKLQSQHQTNCLLH